MLLCLFFFVYFQYCYCRNFFNSASVFECNCRIIWSKRCSWYTVIAFTRSVEILIGWFTRILFRSSEQYMWVLFHTHSRDSSTLQHGLLVQIILAKAKQYYLILSVSQIIILYSRICPDAIKNGWVYYFSVHSKEDAGLANFEALCGTLPNKYNAKDNVYSDRNGYLCG